MPRSVDSNTTSCFVLRVRDSKIRSPVLQRPIEGLSLTLGLLQGTQGGNRQLFRDRELLNILCNNPAKFMQVLEECSVGKTQTLKNVVESVCDDAQKLDGGMIDQNVRTPTKKQQREASQLHPGLHHYLYSYLHQCVLT